MSVINIMFTEAELAPLTKGIQLYIRLLGMFHSPDPLQLRWISDEADLKSTLVSLAKAYQSTESMLGVRKYQGVDYDPEREVLRTMTTYLLSGRDELEQALLNKRNQPMMHLVIKPLCTIMSKYSHRMQLDTIDAITKDVAALVDSTNCYGDYQDALTAQREVREIIKAHEEADKQARDSKKQTRRRRRDPLISMILGAVE